MKLWNQAVVLAVAIVLAAGCEPTSPTADEDQAPPPKQEESMPDDDEQTVVDEEPEAAEPPDFFGTVERQAILEHNADWSKAFEGASVDEDAASALAAVEPGARVAVYLGVWCPDCMREVPRFWRALDAAGEVPFEVEYVGLDRHFSAGDVSIEGLDIEAIPTFIVYRDDEEVGRVVERSENSIESDLGALLSGEQSGKVSATH